MENSSNPKPTSSRSRANAVSSEPPRAPVFAEAKATAAAAASTSHGTSNRDPIPAEAAGTGERTINAGLARLTRKLLDLSDFLEGDCNRLPLAAANQVCETPGLRINPLYLHGNVGVGKTHLLEGIYRKLRRQNPALQVVLLSAESFANHFTDALRQRTLPSFRQRFRTMDVLLVDDIDFLDGKQVIQEEFLHTVKQLEALGKQIVVTADRHPRLLNRVSEELVSRLLSGLVCRIENPDLETRRRIIAHKALKLECEISADVVNEIANRFSGNVRELEGAVHMLAVWQGMTKRRVTLSAARSVLADLERDCVRVVRMTDVEQTVCRFFGVSTDDLRSAKRTRTLSQPRMLAMYLARRLTQSAYKEIGAHFGGRNHSTVMSAERKVEEWLSEGATLRIASQNWQLPELLEAMEQQLRAC